MWLGVYPAPVLRRTEAAATRLVRQVEGASVARPVGSTFEAILPILKAEKVAAYNWGFVDGKTQTIYPWLSPEGAPEPAVWFHDIFRPDGALYIPAEADYIRSVTGKAKRK